MARCNGNWEILLREQSHGALIRDSIVALPGHNHVWETWYLLSRTPTGRIDSWQKQGPTSTSAPIIVIAPLCSTPPPPPQFLHAHIIPPAPSPFFVFSSPSPSLYPFLPVRLLSSYFISSLFHLSATFPESRRRAL